MRIPKMFMKPAMCLKANSPEILLTAGVGLVIFGTVKACKATRHLNELLDAHEEEIERVKAETTFPQDERREITRVYAKTAWELFRLYATSVAIGSAGVCLIFKGHNILRNRYVSLAAAYSLVNKSYDMYRKRVVNEFGEAMDKHFRFGTEEQEVEYTELGKNGKEKTVKKKVTFVDPNLEEYSQYARIFDEFSSEWKDDPALNKAYLLSIQNYANDKLKSDGYLILNWVYKALGYKPTKAGQIAGWVYTPGRADEKVGDNIVDFGLCEVYKKAEQGDVAARMWVNNIEPSVLLDFNCIPDIRPYAFEETI